MGNACGTRIWLDKWLPSPSTYKVSSPISILPQDARFETLIDLETRIWKSELVQQVFLPHEADIICGIALSASLPADKKIWAPTMNGLFSVRSAHKIARELGPRVITREMSDGTRLRSFWKQLWGCNIPHKVCHFTWRAYRDILPTKVNLVHRKVLRDSCCEECQREAESLGHIFWGCSRACDVWHSSKLFRNIDNLRFHSFMDVLWFVMMKE